MLDPEFQPVAPGAERGPVAWGKSLANRTFHRTVDLILRVDRSQTLNRGRSPMAGGGDIAAELYAAVQMMKAEAFDPSGGGVDYRRLCESETYQQYRACTAGLINFDPATLSSAEQRLAFWINLYNALIIDAVIAFDLEGSIREDLGFFRRAAYVIGGQRYSADDIEHGILRGNRRHFHPLILFPQLAPGDVRLAYSLPIVDPRLHCALVCASRSCPPIAVYDAGQIHQQLDVAAANFVNNGGAVVDVPAGRLSLSPIFRWYRRDFGGTPGVIDFVESHLDDGPGRELLRARGSQLNLVYQTYDWSLNGL